MKPAEAVTHDQIRSVLRRLGGWGSVYVPEFTWGKLRIDAAVIDTRTRWVRGFEIKMSRGDFRRDQKWQEYSEFCSALSIVCPHGLIRKEEVEAPFGLLYVQTGSYGTEASWAKRPKRFQRRDGLAWLWTYVRILERELPRLVFEMEQLRRRHGDE